MTTMKNKTFRTTIFLASWALLFSPVARAIAPTPGATTSSYFRHRRAGYLGVDFEDLTAQQRAAFHLQAKQGVAIAAVDHDAPAGQAGLCAQDVVLQMDGRPVQSAAQARNILQKASVGQTLDLTILRNGQSIQKTVQLADRRDVEKRAWSRRYTVPDPARGQGPTGPQPQAKPQMQPQPQEAPPPPQGFFGQASTEFSKTFGPNGVLMNLVPGASSVYTGVEVDTLGPQLAQYFGLKDNAGLLVKSVDRNSPGSRAGIHAGDIVLKVDDVPMTTRSKWQHVLHENRNSLLLLQVQRDRQPLTLTMSIHDTK